jgi:ATP-dependent Clp protease ATP-binding subunit ClpB
MTPDKLTLKSQEALQAAVQLARDRHHPEVMPAHVLHALLGQAEGVVLPLVQRLDVTPTALRSKVEDVLARIPAAYGATGEARLSSQVVDVLNAAEKAAADLGDEYVSTEHLLIALANSDTSVGRTLREEVEPREPIPPIEVDK